MATSSRVARCRDRRHAAEGVPPTLANERAVLVEPGWWKPNSRGRVRRDARERRGGHFVERFAYGAYDPCRYPGAGECIEPHGSVPLGESSAECFNHGRSVCEPSRVRSQTFIGGERV